jgi:hypothetical protein
VIRWSNLGMELLEGTGLVTRVEQCFRTRCDKCSGVSEADVSYHLYMPFMITYNIDTNKWVLNTWEY